MKKLQDMLEIIDEMKKEFPDAIDYFDYIPLMSEEKILYMPEVL